MHDDPVHNQFAIFNVSILLDLERDQGTLPQTAALADQRTITSYRFFSGPIGFNSCENYTTYPSNIVQCPPLL